MAIDPVPTSKSVIAERERNIGRDFKAMEDRIVNEVVTRITRELDKKENIFIDQCKTLFTGSETMLYFEPMHTMLKQIVESQISLIDKVDKIDSMFAAISEQLQKKRPSLVDFQLGGTQKEPVGMTLLELSRQLISTATAPFTCFTPVIGVELDRIIIECKEPTSEKLDGSRMLRRLFSVIGKDHLNKVIYLLDHKDKTVIKPLKDLQHFHDWSKTAKEELATIPVPEGFKITDMRGSPVVVKTEVHAELMQSLMETAEQNAETPLVPEPKKVMTLLDFFSVQKRTILENAGTLFNMFSISFNKGNSEYILTKNSNISIRAIDVIRNINHSVELIKEIDNFHHPVVLETKSVSGSTFTPLVSMKQFIEWLLIKPNLTTQQYSHQSQESDKQQSTPPSGTFPVAAYGVNRTLTVR